MIKNLIIISLVVVIVTGMFTEFLDYLSFGLDKLQELLYTIKSEVQI